MGKSFTAIATNVKAKVANQPLYADYRHTQPDAPRVELIAVPFACWAASSTGRRGKTAIFGRGGEQCHHD